MDSEGNKITKTGVMIHVSAIALLMFFHRNILIPCLKYVISEVDAGEPLLQREIEMIEGETLEELEQRIHTVEWKAIVEGTNIAIRQLKQQRRTFDSPTEAKDSRIS